MKFKRHSTGAIIRWITATMTMRMTVATTPIRIIFSRLTSPAANAVADVAPAHGKTTPTATLAIRMAIDAGLNPTCTAAGMNTLQKSAVAEMKLVVMPTTDAAMNGSVTAPTPSVLTVAPIHSTKPTWVRTAVLATGRPTVNMQFHGACRTVSVHVTSDSSGCSAERIVNRRNITAGGTTQTGSARATSLAAECASPSAIGTNVGNVNSVTIVANTKSTRRSFALRGPSCARSPRRNAPASGMPRVSGGTNHQSAA